MLGLVLSGGGARAAYQVGALARIAERAPDLHVPIVTGASAGAINASLLASHPGNLRSAVGELVRCWESLTLREVMAARFHSALLGAFRLGRKVLTGSRAMEFRSLVDTAPLRRYLEARIPFGGVAANIARQRLHALALNTTCYESGETVTFVQGQSGIAMWQRVKRRSIATAIDLDHLMASAAIPLVFPAVPIAGGHFGDGSVRDTAPLAPAIHLGAARILTITLRHRGLESSFTNAQTRYPSPAQILGLLFNAVFLDALDADIERLERLNRLLAPYSRAPSPEGLRPVALLALRPSVDLAELARPFTPRLPFALHLLGRALALTHDGASQFVSYLLFEPSYLKLLMEVGYADAARMDDAIEFFLSTAG